MVMREGVRVKQVHENPAIVHKAAGDEWVREAAQWHCVVVKAE